MSFFSDDKNKPAVIGQDAIIGTAEVIFMPALDRGKVIIRISIDNQDPTSSLTFTKNGRGGTVFTVPPNSIALIENEVLTGVIVTPNATTGVGLISADTVEKNKLIEQGFIQGAA